MRGVLLTAFVALVSLPRTRAVWLGRLDPKQLLGSWYILAVASGEKGFALEKATKNIEGVVVSLTPENNLKLLSSRHSGRGLLGQAPLQLLLTEGILDYRVLGTNFRDYAIVFTQLEFKDEAFSTVELYSRTELASQEAMGLFTRWSWGLGFLSQQQASLQRDRECRPMLRGQHPIRGGCGQTPSQVLGVPGEAQTSSRLLLPPSHLCAQGLPGKPLS
uniref:Lipocalin 6 n=1 Tax=Canis lupus dingo TaxID=286419 RepID=A0A8C0JN42_CANLU